MSELFGTSGVRGVANEKITPDLALNLSRSLATRLGKSGEVLIGRDTRLSGKMIEDALIGGFLSSGWKARTLGVVPTPVLGFSVSESKADAGAMITASHNPPEYNGIKFFDSQGMALSPSEEQEIETIYNKKDFRTSSWDDIGKAKHAEVIKKYLKSLKSQISLQEEYTVAIDCACGPAAKTTPQLLERLGCKVLTINSQLDGTFPGRQPEPTAENLQDLKNFVRSTEADLGLAHDGDGDRIAAVDEKGKVVEEDKLLALISSYSAERFESGIVTTVAASKIVDEQVSKAKGTVSRTKVGDVNVAQEMKARDFKFGGEPSGTWILGDVHMCPDGTLAAARILEMLDKKTKSLAELTESMPSYPILRAKVECPNEEKSTKMKHVKDRAPSAFENVANELYVDGVRLEFKGGDWILIRPSGTEPYIRITAEADEKERAKSFVKTAKKLLK